MSDQERAARYSDLFESSHEHPPNCAYCPICATIAVVRNTKPEVLDHLAAAARELIAAAGILIEEASDVIGADPARTSERDDQPPKIRRIDIG